MAISATQILYVLKKFKDLPNKAKAIRTVRVDDKEVKSFTIKRIELDIGALDVELEYTLQGSAPTKVSAHHVFRSDEPDVIKVDGSDAEDDNVDLDVDLHLLRADIEYRLQYIYQGARHEVFMLASIDWFGV